MHLGDKGLWQIIDFLAAILFIFTGFLICLFYTEIDEIIFLPIVMIGVILFVVVLWSLSGSYYDYSESPEDIYMRGEMWKDIAIKIMILSSIFGGGIFFWMYDGNQ